MGIAKKNDEVSVLHSDWLLYGRGCSLIGQLSNIALVTLNMCNALSAIATWMQCKKILSRMQALAAKRKKAGPSSGEGTPSGNSTQAETTAPTPASGLSAPDNPDQSTLSFSDCDVRDCLDEWVRALASDDLQMLSLLLFEFVRRERSATVMNGRCSCVKGRAQVREDHCC